MMRLELTRQGIALITRDASGLGNLPFLLITTPTPAVKAWAALLVAPETETDQRYGIGRRFLRRIALPARPEVAAFRIFGAGIYEAQTSLATESEFEIPIWRIIFNVPPDGSIEKLGDSHAEDLRDVYRRILLEGVGVGPPIDAPAATGQAAPADLQLEGPTVRPRRRLTRLGD